MSEFYFIDNVLEKFAKEEIEIELKLRNLQAKYEKYSLLNQDGSGDPTHVHASRDAALKRNKSFLKDLEIQAAKLRSRTYFCPTDIQLTTLKKQYFETPTRQKRHVPK